MNALAWAELLIKFLPLAISGVSAASELLHWGADKIKAMVADGRDPTAAEWDELNARTGTLRGQLHSDAV